MNPVIDFILMHGYAKYIWSAYGITGLILMINLIHLKRQKQNTFKKLQQWYKQG